MSKKSRKQNSKNRFLEDDDFDYIVVDDLEDNSVRPIRAHATWSTLFRSGNCITVKPKRESRLPGYWQLAPFRDQPDSEDWETWYLQ